MSTSSNGKPTKTILIDAKHPHELRVAIVDNSDKKNPNRLIDLHIEDENRSQYNADICLGKVSSLEPSLNAAFVEFSDGRRHGFLPAKEVADKVAINADHGKSKTKRKKSANTKPAEPLPPTSPPHEESEAINSGDDEEQPLNISLDGNTSNKAKCHGDDGAVNFKITENQTSQTAQEKQDEDRIDHKLEVGQTLLVQVVKEERGTKGAALTTHISLAGSYLVLMPLSPEISGISRRIEGADRDSIKELTKSLVCPEGMGFIIRTAGLNQSVDQLQWDLDVLVNLWRAIEKATAENQAPLLIHQESDIVVRAVRDHLRQQVGKMIINDKNVFEKIKQYVTQIKPDFVDKLELYDDSTPLFCQYRIESQIEQAQQREIRLAAGGSIVIDHTEALISIDVNSARAKGTDIEDTAFNTNLDAAQEIARQLRLRDIGGLIVIDFIDMNNAKNQREVENHLKHCLKDDRARLRIGRISSFGLLEMSRQRLNPSLNEVTKINCPRCDGQGMIQSIESVSTSIIRRIQEDVMNEQLLQVQIHVPLEVCAQLMNHHRMTISDIETTGKTSILIVPNPNYQSPQFRIKKIRFGEKGTKAAQMESKSFQLIENIKFNQGEQERKNDTAPAGPVVEAASHSLPKPKAPKNNLIKRLWDNMFSGSGEANLYESEDNDDNIGNRIHPPKNQKTRSNNNNGRRRNTTRRPGQRRSNPNGNGNTNKNKSENGNKKTDSVSSSPKQNRRPRKNSNNNSHNNNNNQNNQD